MLETSKEYAEGWESYPDGWQQNPYTHDSEQYWNWFRGYRDHVEQVFNEWCE